MRLKILGSSSAGNAYLLDSGGEVLLIECGVPMRQIKQALGYDLARLCGALVSHEHQDHAQSAEAMAGCYVPVYMSRGTAEALRMQSTAKVIEPMQSTRIGAFEVMGFPVKHDCREPMGFLIRHPDMGTTLFATDTYYLPYRFRSLSHIIIECNYRADLLDSNVAQGYVHPAQRERTLQSHMSYDTCREALLAADLSRVHNIVLTHLSPGNSHADDFLQGIRKATGKSVHIAERGVEIDFDKTPF